MSMVRVRGLYGLAGGVILVFSSLAQRCCAQRASAPPPRKQLQQFVAQLQADPSDDSLRTKIIQLALTIDPKPAVPDEATEAAAKGTVIFRTATTPTDANAAAAAFAQASLLAPWVPDFYYDQGLALEKAGQFEDAIRALNFCLTAAPNAPDADEIRGHIDGIRYEEQKAERDAQAAAQQREADTQAEFARKFGGKWCGTGGKDQGAYVEPSQSDCIWIDSPGSVRISDDFTLGGSWDPSSIQILKEESHVVGIPGLQGDTLTFEVSYSLSFYGHWHGNSVRQTYSGDETFTLRPSFDGTKLEGMEQATVVTTETYPSPGSWSNPDATENVTFVRQ